MAFEAQKQFFTDLFTAPESPGHGVRVSVPGPGDITDRIGVVASGTVEQRAQMAKTTFEHECACLDALGDDRVPMLHVWTGTNVIAEDFGCPVHLPEGSMPFARPAVFDAEAADRIVEPDVMVGPMGDVFRIADRLVELCGAEHTVRICDIQSPFDVGALIWQKESFLVAMVDAPDAVHRLLRKVTDTQIRFIRTFRDRYENVCLVHYPNLWMRPAWGATMSEDDCGSVSTAHFEAFCLPYLTEISRAFGGIGLHSCAQSQHQWDALLELPNLRYLNLHHPPTELAVAVEKCSGHAVLSPGGANGHTEYLDFVRECLSLARPNTRFFFETGAEDLDAARDQVARIKDLCARVR